MVKAEEYSYRIPLLLKEQGSGKIHSIFQNGLNIKAGGSLIFIGNRKNGQIPFGIHLKNEDIQGLLHYCSADMEVAWDWESQMVLFPEPGIVLSCGEAEVFNNSLSNLGRPLRPEMAEAFFDLLIKLRVNTGIGISAEEFLASEKAGGDVETHVRSLVTACQSSDRDAVESTLRYFLGRGPGLTPSGDDILIGFLVIDALTGYSSSLFKDVLGGLARDGGLTTDVSREFLLYALNGDFSSVVNHAAEMIFNGNKQLCEEALVRLLETGHSSGMDTAFGMMVGLTAAFGQSV